MRSYTFPMSNVHSNPTFLLLFVVFIASFVIQQHLISIFPLCVLGFRYAIFHQPLPVQLVFCKGSLLQSLFYSFHIFSTSFSGTSTKKVAFKAFKKSACFIELLKYFHHFLLYHSQLNFQNAIEHPPGSRLSLFISIRAVSL